MSSRPKEESTGQNDRWHSAAGNSRRVLTIRSVSGVSRRSMTLGSFRDNDGGQILHRMIENIVNENIAVLAVILDFILGLGQPAGRSPSSRTLPSARLRLRRRVARIWGLGGRTKMLTASGIFSLT